MTSEFVQIAHRENSVYLGIWTNWTHGSVAGLTLTTTLQNGGLLVAFLALFVTFTGTAFWTIMSFAVHQILSRQTPQNAIYHQRQAILRNSDTGAAAVWRLTRMAWTWRKQSRSAALRPILLPLIMSLVTLGAFAVAGVFSSRVATTRGGEVLVVGDKCATLNASLYTTENVGLGQTYLASRIKSSAAYASACYARSGSADSCRTYIRDTLPFTITRNASCPFPGKDRICHSSDGAIRLDSGFLNSHSDLGINSSPSTRFTYRTVKECAPLRGDGFKRWDSSESSTVPATFSYQYGEDKRLCNNTSNNCTWEWKKEERNTNRRIGYDIVLTERYAMPNSSYSKVADNNAWKPIPELLIPTADLSIYFLGTNNMAFSAPINDPWFKATQGPYPLDTNLGTQEIYRSGDPARPLGCVQRYQFCNPSLEKNSSCTPLVGILEAYLLASSTLFPEPKHREAFLWSSSAILYMASGFTEFIEVLRSEALRASETVSGIGQNALPNNQWELELEHWFKFTLADLQRAILDQAVGPGLPETAQFHSRPTSAEAQTVCNSQKIRSDSFTSFNVLGLVLIFSIGGLIMIISACLPWATQRIRREKKLYAGLEWITNDTLQLQRLAHEAVGAGRWEGACDDYPRTRKDDLLAALDITDRKHPVLRAPREICMMKKGNPEEDSTKTCDSTQASLWSVDIPRVKTCDSAQESLLSVEIPRVSLDLKERLDSMRYSRYV